MPSGSFMNWEKGGKGAWITTYANEGHIYAVIAGLRLDTSMTTGDGPGWSKEMRSSSGYVAGIRRASKPKRNSHTSSCTARQNGGPCRCRGLQPSRPRVRLATSIT